MLLQKNKNKIVSCKAKTPETSMNTEFQLQGGVARNIIII